MTEQLPMRQVIVGISSTINFYSEGYLDNVIINKGAFVVAKASIGELNTYQITETVLEAKLGNKLGIIIKNKRGANVCRK